MTQRTVSTVFPDVSTAEEAVEALIGAGFASDQISVLIDQGQGQRVFPGDEHPVEEGTAWGASFGALLGGAMMVSLAAGGVFVAGPIAAVLAAASSGAVGGGLVGALIALGLPSHQAEAFEARVRAGGVAVAVETETEDRAEEGAALLEARGDAQSRDLLVVSKPKP